MKQFLISLLFSKTILATEPRGVKYEKAEEFSGADEVYRIHFYPKSGSTDDEYVLVKRITSQLTQQVNVQEIPDPKYYMTRVAHELARWQGYTSHGAQDRFVTSDFNLDYSQLWQYGCYGQLRPYRHGGGDPVDVFDKIYKDHQTCLACVKHDFGKMIPQYSFCYDLEQFRFLCPHDEERNTEAQWSQCECDAKLANKLAKVRAFTQDFMLNNEVTEEQCRDNRGMDGLVGGARGSIAKQPKCCGEYPSRFVFHTDGNRQCCGGKLFSSNSKKCCSNTITGLEESCN